MQVKADGFVLLPCRNAACHLHERAIQLWADPQPWRHKSRKPQVLQPAGLQRSEDPPWLSDECHEEPGGHRRDLSLPVQCAGQGFQHLTILPKPQPGSLSVGVCQLLWHVGAPGRLRGHHWDGWPGTFSNIRALLLGRTGCLVLSVVSLVSTIDSVLVAFDQRGTVDGMPSKSVIQY